MMTTADTSTVPLLVAVVDAGESQQSHQLYHTLLFLHRQEPLTEVVHCGEGEGMVAWRRLVDVHKLAVKSRVAEQLLSLVNWNFAGGVEARSALLERVVLGYEQRSGGHLSAKT